MATLGEKFWKSLLHPPRKPYSDKDLLGSFVSLDSGVFSRRLDFELPNALGHKLGLSVYFPCSESGEVSLRGEFVIYCHGLGGCRTEGLSLLGPLAKKGVGLVVFDFAGSGFSEGNGGSLGVLEAVDLDAIVRFVRTEVMARRVALWSRSTGAAAAAYHCSGRFRRLIKTKFESVEWAPKGWVDCVVLDGCFADTKRLVDALFRRRAHAAAKIVAPIAMEALTSEIRKRGIDTEDLSPLVCAAELKIPTLVVARDGDELADLDAAFDIFRRVPAKMKKLQSWPAKAASSDQQRLDEAVDFLRFVFDARTRLTALVDPPQPLTPRLYAPIPKHVQLLPPSSSFLPVPSFSSAASVSPVSSASLVSPVSPPSPRGFISGLMKLQVDLANAPLVPPSPSGPTLNNFFDELLYLDPLRLRTIYADEIIPPVDPRDNFFFSESLIRQTRPSSPDSHAFTHVFIPSGTRKETPIIASRQITAPAFRHSTDPTQTVSSQLAAFFTQNHSSAPQKIADFPTQDHPKPQGSMNAQAFERSSLSVPPSNVNYPGMISFRQTSTKPPLAFNPYATIRY